MNDLFSRGALAIFTVAAALGTAGLGAPPQRALKVLMITGGGAHDYQSLPAVLADRLTQRGEMKVQVTDHVSPSEIPGYDVLLFNNCQDCQQGKLDDAARQAILDFLRGGKGVAAMHCALWSYQEWPEWRKILGGLTTTHAAFGTYSVSVLDPAHPVMLGMGNLFDVTDEAYFVDERNPALQVLARTSAAQTGRDGSKRPAPEPQVWTKSYEKGRVFVMTFGHDEKSQGDEQIISLLHRGIRWAGRLTPEPQHNKLTKGERQTGWRLLFNGRNLDGWTGDTAHWTVEDGELVGRSKDLPHNTFLSHKDEFGDFVLKYWVKLGNHNSGVQFRSRQFADNVVKGYQADIADKWYGSLYEEGGKRGVLVNGWKDKGEKVTVLDGWNDMTVRAVGPKISIMLNGVTTVEYTEQDPAAQPASGVIALQLHAGPPMEVRFRDIRIQPANR